MSPRASLFLWFSATAVAACAAHGAESQLSGKSPFMAKAAAGAAAPTANAPLEFVGYYEDSGGRMFRIRDTASKKGVWLRLNERSDEPNLLVKEHDEGQRTLTVEHQGRVLTLAAREAKIASSGPLSAAMPAAPLPSNVPAAVTQSVVLNPTAASESQRLNDVAAEVARRRALRVQAEQNVAPAVVSPPATPAPSPPPMQSVPNRPR